MTGSRTVLQIQQEFADNSGFRNEIIWDLLSNEQANILKDKIKQLIPDQENGRKARQQMRKTLFEKIWAQRKYTNRNSLSSIIYVLVTKEENFNLAPQAKEFSCHPVFRTRKCVADSGSSACCMIFIDEVGRVYQNWQAYLTDNELPKGTMVVPLRGVYTFGDTGSVRLEVYPTPASSLTSQVLVGADVTTAVAGFGSALVPIAAMLTVPVAASVVVGAGIVGMASAGYATIRSGSNLVDRSKHDQSISLADRQARGSWLGVVAGIVGFGASRATRSLSTAAAAGREISVVTEIVVNGLNISSIVLSGSGIANGVLDLVLKYTGDEDISVLDWLQLSASLVLFTHSVSNFRLASSIVNNTRNSTIQSYRKELSNRQRRMFDKMTKETIRISGNTRGKIDIIRSVNDIPSKQYLNDLYKINKQLNEQSVRPAFGGADNGVVLNNELPVDTQELRKNLDMLGKVTQPIPPSYSESAGGTSGNRQVRATTLLYASSRPSARMDEDSGVDIREGGVNGYALIAQTFRLATIQLAENIKVPFSEFSSRIFEHIVNGESFETVVTTICDVFGEKGIRFFMRLADTFMSTMLAKIHAVLQTLISVESILYRMMTHVLEEYKGCSIEWLQQKSEHILKAVKAHFLSLNPQNSGRPLTKCSICPGYFSMCQL